MSQAYRIKGVPETFVIDKQGQLIKVIVWDLRQSRAWGDCGTVIEVNQLPVEKIQVDR